ncbi:protein FAM188A [Echinococcus multilocularis]|uniref:Ubiquitin carboxyl-terminal hydrolase MINDY n=1 Tax=Echinococcus multilocularis TaxID=6211 RepID=A0A068YJP6_ECHMU|nr:protein FAM188A [Echinococcus multilocularis]
MVFMLSDVAGVNLLVWGPSEPSDENFRRWCQGFQFSDYEQTALLQINSGPCAVIAAVQAGILRQVLFTTNHPIPVHSKLFPMTSGFQRFVSGLSLTSVDTMEDLHALIISLIPAFESEFGILCFLYSILVTHGLENVKNGMTGETETLIDSNFGNASQCLLNLLLTGQSSPYLFDGKRDLSGFCMQGITEQPKTGFLTIMESLRYCEVGWFLKNPSTPIWIIGSESHFTVLASPCLELVSVEPLAPLLQSEQKSRSSISKSSLWQAEREFENLCESSDAGFLTYEKYEQLLGLLRLPNDETSIRAATTTMDPDGMQIILRKPFFDYYYSDEIRRRGDITSEFQVLHFNGLPVGQPRDKVMYRYGVAKIVDPMEESPPTRLTTLDRCLRTKWPTIQVTWQDGLEPIIDFDGDLNPRRRNHYASTSLPFYLVKHRSYVLFRHSAGWEFFHVC